MQMKLLRPTSKGAQMFRKFFLSSQRRNQGYVTPSYLSPTCLLHQLVGKKYTRSFSQMGTGLPGIPNALNQSG